jgi:hypothetical protein
MRAPGEMTVENPVEPMRLRREALLGGLREALVEAQEEMRLSQNRPEAAHLPHQPLHDLGPFCDIGRQEPAAAFGQIDHDRTGFENRQARVVTRVVIDDGRDLVVGRYLQKFGRMLLVVADIDRDNLVGQVELFEHDGNLAAVRRAPGI